MKNKRSRLVLLFMAGLLAACTYTPPEPADDPTNPRVPPVAGNADFSKYVAVGNSLTAGFMNNALYLDGQQHAYPVILSERMKLVNGNAAFNYPALGAAGGNGLGFLPGTTTAVGRLQFLLPSCPVNAAATKTLGLTPVPKLPAEPLAPYAGNKAALNNFSAPGTKSFHAGVQGYGALNPYYWRFASGPTASLLGDAVAAKGTFFTYWLGSNDVLSYATSGGNGGGGRPNPGLNPVSYGPNDMTDHRVFAQVLNNSLDALFSAGASTKGAIANIPDVVNIPFFLQINRTLTAGGPFATLPFRLSADTAAFLNARWQGQGASGVNFQAGKVNYPVIATAAGLRHMDPEKDFLVLSIPQDSLLLGRISACNPGRRGGWGITRPIPDRFVLDAAEVALVRERVAAFNEVIRQQVNARGDRLALVDINTLLGNLSNVRNNIAPGGYFSLDGVHPNARGQAVIANEFIRAINARYKSTLPPVNIMLYPQNALPKP